MFAWLKQWQDSHVDRRENEARQIVIDHLDKVVARAKFLEEELYRDSTSKKSQAFFIAHAYRGLGTSDLKSLLRINDDGIADWVNTLPEVRAILQVNKLMFISTHPRHEQSSATQLIIVNIGSTSPDTTQPEE